MPSVHWPQTRYNPTSFRYAPASKALATSVEQVQRAYHNGRVAIIQLMTMNTMVRVRAGAIRRFAEAVQVRNAKKCR